MKIAQDLIDEAQAWFENDEWGGQTAADMLAAYGQWKLKQAALRAEAKDINENPHINDHR